MELLLSQFFSRFIIRIPINAEVWALMSSKSKENSPIAFTRLITNVGRSDTILL